MPMLDARAPVIILDADTSPAHAARLAAMLDNHGAGAILAALDAIAALTTAPAPAPAPTPSPAPLSELVSAIPPPRPPRPPAGSAIPPAAGPKARLCGAPTVVGGDCKRPWPCYYHPARPAPAPPPPSDDAPAPALPGSTSPPDDAPAPQFVPEPAAVPVMEKAEFSAFSSRPPSQSEIVQNCTISELDADAAPPAPPFPAPTPTPPLADRPASCGKCGAAGATLQPEIVSGLPPVWRCAACCWRATPESPEIPEIPEIPEPVTLAA